MLQSQLCWQPRHIFFSSAGLSESIALLLIDGFNNNLKIFSEDLRPLDLSLSWYTEWSWEICFGSFAFTWCSWWASRKLTTSSFWLLTTHKRRILNRSSIQSRHRWKASFLCFSCLSATLAITTAEWNSLSMKRMQRFVWFSSSTKWVTFNFNFSPFNRYCLSFTWRLSLFYLLTCLSPWWETRTQKSLKRRTNGNDNGRELSSLSREELHRMIG